MSSMCVHRSEAISVLAGDDRQALLDRLVQLSIDGGSSGELRGYVEEDLDRFQYTLGLVPGDVHGRGLEVGANPYFMSILLREFRPGLSFDCTNYFEGSPDDIRQVVRWKGVDGTPQEHCFHSRNVNLERDGLPAEDASYDVILFCEVLEHFTMDPLHCVLELHRVLKPGGRLVLTTPNVARYENVAALLEGRNLYDPYSGYGPHGRHNREYTRHELHLLMRHAGFECELDFTSDVHPNTPTAVDPESIVQVLAQVQHRENDLGQYLFSRWRKTSAPANSLLPSWLYRSYSKDRFA
jgi:SAM-dependent methyltransferase